MNNHGDPNFSWFGRETSKDQPQCGAETVGSAMHTYLPARLNAPAQLIAYDEEGNVILDWPVDQDDWRAKRAFGQELTDHGWEILKILEESPEGLICRVLVRKKARR